MTILVDHEITEGLKQANPVAIGLKPSVPGTADSQIQAASLDLSVGDIFVPGADELKPGGVKTPLKEITLAQGHTAVIRSTETLNLGPNLAGIAFPPASVSIKGLLTTNPGHIDPGYKGQLHLTVINMGREPFFLKRGDRIMRVLFIKLHDSPDAPYDVRSPHSASPITSELLSRLSRDFLSVEDRATTIAKQAVRNAGLIAAIISASIGALAAVAVAFISAWGSGNSAIHGLSERVSGVEARVQVEDVVARLRSLEEAVADLKKNVPGK